MNAKLGFMGRGLLVLLAGFMTVSAQANDWTYAGATITDGNWTLSVTGTENLTISYFHTGSGLLDLSKPIVGGAGNERITAINDRVFNGNPALTGVVFPDSLVFIGEAAFYGCANLVGEIRLCGPQPVVLDRGQNFTSTGITSANLSSVIEIPYQAFSSCASLTNLVLSTNLRSIGATAFAYTSALKTLTPFLPDTVEYLGNAAFYDSAVEGDLQLRGTKPTIFDGRQHFLNAKLTSADLSSVTNIAGDAFHTCVNLTNLVLSTNLRSIGERSFANNVSLKTVTPFLPNTVEYLDNAAFFGCALLTGTLSLANPNPITFIGGDQFSGAQLISGVIIGEGTTEAPGRMLDGCGAIRQVWFCGDKPNNWEGAWPSLNGIPSYEVRYYVPRANAVWEAFASSYVTTPTPQEYLDFADTYPTERAPIGTFRAGSNIQWYCYWTPPRENLKTTVISIR